MDRARWPSGRNTLMRFVAAVMLVLLMMAPTAPAQTQVAATPPMGWNSWNHFECKVTAADVRGAADAIATNGMKDAGYLYGKGLKIGIYSSPGPKTCAGYEGTYGHEEQDARTYAEWGIDYLKYDWCSASRLYSSDNMP